MAESDLTNELPANHALFRKHYNPIILESGEVTTPVAAELA
jgi:hypothetical protein